MHTRHIFTTASLIVAALCLPGAVHAADGWTDNVAEALKQAAAEKKDVLLDFTGSDWCGWCIKLHEEVFEKEPFKTDAPKKFVLVSLDFPQDKSKLSKETIKQNEQWEKKLQPEGFPSVFLTDDKGIPYAITGYEEGGPEKYLAHLKTLAEVRTKRDAALATAAKAEGAAKAKALDEALTAVGETLALAHYNEQVKEILALDADNKAGLKGKYEQLLNNHEAHQALAKLHEELEEQDDHSKSLTKLDEIAEKYKPSGEVRQELLILKVNLLGEAKKYDDGLKLLDELLADKTLEEATRREFVVLKVSVLSEAEKHADALKLLDELLADKALDDTERQEYSVQKAGVLVNLDLGDEALKIFDSLLATLAKESEERFVLLAQKADVLAELGKTDDALKTYDEAIAAAPDASIKKQLKNEKRKLEKQAARDKKKAEEKKEE